MTRMRQKRPMAPGTGNPLGRESSLPSWSHQWNCWSYPIQHSTNACLYSTTFNLSCPSRYIPFFSCLNVYPSFSNQQITVLMEINGLLMPFCAFKNPFPAFSTIRVLISYAMSLSSRIVPCFLFNWWKGRSLHLRNPIIHLWMHRAWFVPCPCVLATSFDTCLQEYSKFTSV